MRDISGKFSGPISVNLRLKRGINLLQPNLRGDLTPCVRVAVIVLWISDDRPLFVIIKNECSH